MDRETLSRVVTIGVALVAITGSALSISSCGRPVDRELFNTRVSGAVTFDGKPMPVGEVVVYHPRYGPYASTLDEAGRYSIRRVEPGEHPVLVRPVAPGREDKELEAKFPKKYSDPRTSGLKVTVKDGGETTFDIALTSAP